MRSAREPRAGGALRLTTWICLALLVAYLVDVGGGYVGIYLTQVRLFDVVLIGGVLAAWLVAMWREPHWRPRTILWPAFGASLAVFTISLALSKTPRYGVDYLAYAVLLTALYLLLVRLMAHPFFRNRLGVLAVGLCLATGGWYLIVVGQEWLSWWSLVGRVTTPPLRPNFEGLTFGNPSAVLTVCVLLLAASAAYLGLATRGRTAMLGLLTVLTLAVVGISGSRAGWMAIAIGTVVTGGAWLATEEHRRIISSLLAPVRVRVALGIVALAGVAVVLAFLPTILNRVLSGGESLRGTFYLVAIRIFEAAPILGTGPGTWVAQRIRYTLPGETDYYIPHAHDLYLQTLAEFGLLGAFAGLLVIGLLFWLIRDGIRDPDPVRRRFGWAALFASVYFGAHQLLDFYANMPAALFVYALPIAWLDATTRHSPIEEVGKRFRAIAGRFRLVSATIAVALLAAAVTWAGWTEAPALKMSAGVDLANAGHWNAALPDFRAAASMDPGVPPYHFALGLAEANTGDWRKAEVEFDSVAGSDDLPVAWLDLAAARARLGDPAGEQAALAQALRLGDQQAAVNLDAGVLYLGLGERDQAVQAFGRAIALAPSFIGDPWWQSDPARAALWSDVYRAGLADATASVAQAPDGPFEVALYAGHLDEASSLAVSAPRAAEPRILQEVLAAWGGDRVAVQALYARAQAHPLDIPVVLWCGRVAEHIGDTANVARFRAWADLAATAGYGLMRVRVSASAEGRDIAGISSGFWGQYTYRRQTPWNQIVDALPHLAYE